MKEVKVRYLGNLQTECIHESGAKIETDAPKDNSGKGETFSPTDLFSISIGSCMLTLMAIQSRNLGIELKEMTAQVQKQMKINPRRIGKIIIRIRSCYLPTPEIQKKIEQAAINCPVHLSLHSDIRVEIDFVWGL